LSWAPLKKPQTRILIVRAH